MFFSLLKSSSICYVYYIIYIYIYIYVIYIKNIYIVYVYFYQHQRISISPADATTDDVTMDTLGTLIIEPTKTIRYSKMKLPDKHTINDILFKERNLTEVKLADFNDRLALLIKEEKIKKSTLTWHKLRG